MRSSTNYRSTLTLLALFGAASASNAAEIFVTADIVGSETWTANNKYNLQDQIYVLPGASLTIEAGTIVASTTGLGGSLAVTNGGQIFILGTATKPVIMTSDADVLTWVGGDPTTGTWREACNEWGNLTVMGDAYISEDATPGNTAIPSASNDAKMEGLIDDVLNDPKNRYGGGNDDYDAGTINFLSCRYGGRVIGLNDELNGLSFGGLGRETDVSYVEVMNNVDDGIEIWGGTFDIDHFSVWNIGDDSFDVDQGWRGSASFGVIVQGYSIDADQGSGVGDNGFETDGAENSDWQPVTTTTLYNMTFIGQPDGDGATAWRDSARVQYRNSIFMDCGEELIRFDNVDGDGGLGYGNGGTLSWNDCWTTSFSQTSTVNPFPGNPADFYTTQTSGTLCEFSNNVMFGNDNGSAYTNYNALGLNGASHNNLISNSSPIQSIARAAEVIKGGKKQERVIALDPRPANDALTNAAAGGPADYCGAIAPDQNWLCGWTAADRFGFIVRPAASVSIVSNANNIPGSLAASGLPAIGAGGFGWIFDNPTGCAGIGIGSPIVLLTTAAGVAQFPLPIGGWGCGGGVGNLLINFPFVNAGTAVGVYGGAPTLLPFPIPDNPALCGLPLASQVLAATGALAVRAGNAASWVIGA